MRNGWGSTRHDSILLLFSTSAKDATSSQTRLVSEIAALPRSMVSGALLLHNADRQLLIITCDIFAVFRSYSSSLLPGHHSP